MARLMRCVSRWCSSNRYIYWCCRAEDSWIGRLPWGKSLICLWHTSEPFPLVLAGSEESPIFSVHLVSSSNTDPIECFRGSCPNDSNELQAERDTRKGLIPHLVCGDGEVESLQESPYLPTYVQTILSAVEGKISSRRNNTASILKLSSDIWISFVFLICSICSKLRLKKKT